MIGRRDLLKAAGAAAGLTLLFELEGCGAPPTPRLVSAPASSAPPAFAPSAFVRIAPDGKVTLYAIRLEMGQGVQTRIFRQLIGQLGDFLEHMLKTGRVPAPPKQRLFN